MLAATALLLALQAPAAADAPIDLPRLLDELTDRSALARLPEPAWRAYMASSADRRSFVAGGNAFANEDWGQAPVRRFEQPRGQPLDLPWKSEQRVLLDASGPGAVVRIWSANPKGRLRVYVDHVEPTGMDDQVGPVLDVDFAALLDGRAGVGTPLAGTRARGGSLYLPIPFADRCVITCDDAASLYHHVEWRRYEPGARVASFVHGDLERHRAAIARANRRWSAPPQAEGEDTFTYHLSSAAPRGELLGIGSAPARGPRAVSELRLRVDATDPAAALRHCTLRLAFDGEETVAVPLGAFFASPHDVRALQSWFLSVEPPGDLVARWVMPYRERFELWIDNAGDPDLHVAGTVKTIPWTWDERSLRFHATWRASGPLATRPFSRVTHLDARGTGLLVGDVLTIANPVPAWWGEGDEIVRVDDEPLPSHWGTGTEDLYGYAWCDPTPFQAPLFAQLRCDGPGNFGITTLFRFRALDAIPFTRALRYEQEMWHWADTTVQRAACVVWYAQPGATETAPPLRGDPAATLPALAVRRVAGAVEAETARVLAASEGLQREPQAFDGVDWSGGLQLWVRAARDGDFLELEVPAAPGRRSITVLATRSWDYGVVRFSVDGVPAGAPFDGRNPEGHAVAGPVEVPLGEHEVGATFRLRAEVVGTNPTSEPPHRYFGLDAVVVR